MWILLKVTNSIFVELAAGAVRAAVHLSLVLQSPTGLSAC